MVFVSWIETKKQILYKSTSLPKKNPWKLHSDHLVLSPRLIAHFLTTSLILNGILLYSSIFASCGTLFSSVDGNCLSLLIFSINVRPSIEFIIRDFFNGWNALSTYSYVSLQEPTFSNLLRLILFSLLCYPCRNTSRKYPSFYTADTPSEILE